NGVGIYIESGAYSNVIGPHNIIAYNANAIMLQPTLDAPRVRTPQPTNYNRFTQNVMFNSGNALAIDLTPFGKPNTTFGDPDANQGVRTPAITAADRTSVVVRTCASCIVELFLSSRGAGLGGQGKDYLATATASSAGVATFTSPRAAF